MIDPLSLTVATLIASKALESAAGEAGRTAWAALGRLANVVRNRLAGDSQSERLLQAVEHVPTDEERVRELAAQLEERMRADKEFRRELESIVAEARRDPRSGQFVTQVADQAQVGKLVIIGRARDVEF
jgi:hypothetical protein